MINVLGDALAAGIIAHLCRKDFPLSETGKVSRKVLSSKKILNLKKKFKKCQIILRIWNLLKFREK